MADDPDQAPPSRVIVFTGLPGTGKSTLAELIARRINAPAFAGDWLLGALKPAARLLVGDHDVQVALYRSLLRSLIMRQLILGQSAIVDCVLSDDMLVDWQTLTKQHGAALSILECVCSDEALHRSRIEGRVRDIPGWHEIDWDHVVRMRAELPRLTIDRLVLDSVRPLETNAAAVIGYLDRFTSR